VNDHSPAPYTEFAEKQEPEGGKEKRELQRGGPEGRNRVVVERMPTHNRKCKEPSGDRKRQDKLIWSLRGGNVEGAARRKGKGGSFERRDPKGKGRRRERKKKGNWGLESNWNPTP